MRAYRRSYRLIMLVLVFSLGASIAPAQWYVSGESGVLRELVPEEQAMEHEYAVRVERSPSLETHTLYREGEVVERTELEYSDGVLLARRIYRGGEVVATEHYRYWSDGALRYVRRVSDRGSTVEYRYRAGRLYEEWVTRSTVQEQMRYDQVGRLVSRVTRESGEITERESREYWGDSAGDALRRVVVVADGRETVRRYDEEGRFLGASVARDGEVESDRVRIYEDGVLVGEREERDGSTRVWRYEYDGDRLAIERYLEDDELVRLTRYSAQDDGGEYTRIETLYRSGAPALRVYYTGEQRVMEEVIRDDEVIRTRTFARSEEDQ